jgi:hypothetical protein
MGGNTDAGRDRRNNEENPYYDKLWSLHFITKMEIMIATKIVGICSKCRLDKGKIEKDINGRAYKDNEISCISCMVNNQNEK